MTEAIQENLDADEAFYNAVHPGTLIEETPEGFLFDIGADAPAFVGKDELKEGTTFNAGESYDLLIERPFGKYWAASYRKVELLAMWDRLEGLVESGEEIEGRIVGSNKGGLSVDIGVRAFVPKSQIDVHRVDDFAPYMGRTEKFQVTEFDRKRANVVLSRRGLVEASRKLSRKELLENIEVGKTYEGTIRNVVKYGAFVDIGGLEGLLHKSNMSWGRIDDPAEFVRPGDKINVVILEYNKGKKRLSLGRKQLLEDPWKAIDNVVAEGDIVQGKVVSLADFGAFVEVADGLEGLVHVTELSWTDRINHPREVLELGAVIKVKVVGIDGENRRLSLSVKRLESNPWESLAKDLTPGQRITGKVSSLTDFGIFVQVAPGIDGLVHVSDLSWTEKVENPASMYNVGDEIEVVLLDIDPDSTRISLGVKQLSEDPWDTAEAIAKPGKRLDVKITRTTDFGAFAEIMPGIEGLIHISELSHDNVDRVESVVKSGQEVKALVMSFDRANRRIGLSLKREDLEDMADVREYTDEGGATATLGDILRDRLGLADGGEKE